MLTVSDDSPGTPERDWLGWPALRSAPPLDVGSPGRLVVVAPHPDDEVLGAAGLMCRVAGQGGSVEIVAVTDGEASHIGLDGALLGARRRTERAAALRCLGIEPVVQHLALPDGRVSDREEELTDRLTAMLEPTSVCVSPWRCDGHPDHEAVARAALTAGARRGCRVVEYPVWAWHWATPEHGLPRADLRRLELPVADHLAKVAAIEQFGSQIRRVPESPADPVVLPAAVLDRFRRGFETYVVGGCAP